MSNENVLRDKMLPAPLGGGFKMEGYWVWCGSVVKGEDNRYHMFASRWRNYLPMHPGWLVGSEVVRASSDTPDGPYQFEEVVLPARGAEYWDGRATHNPHIKKHNGKYILYYTGITHVFDEPVEGDEVSNDSPSVIMARASKRIGIATSDSVFGPFKRHEAPIMPTRPGKFDSFLTTNAAPIIHEDGSVVMMYKARAYEGHKHGKMTIGVAKFDHYTSMQCQEVSDEMIFEDEKVHIEDPYIWYEDGKYYMIAKDMEGNVCGQMHGGVMATSVDGMKWVMDYGSLSYTRNILWNDSKERVMGSLERPFILFEEGAATHMFFATADGPGGFWAADNTWNMVIPLKH